MPEPVSTRAPELPGRTVASQRWTQLAFLHWRVESSRVAAFLPPGVLPDEHDGSTWVGLIGFRLDRATLFGSPPVPHLGDFAEMNVRLYGVDESGRRGVVFRSLEASRLAAVVAARAAFSLPYFWSRTAIEHRDDEVAYRAKRHLGAGSTLLRVRPGAPLQPDATEAFLTARWGLYTRRLGRTVFLPNWHEPWPLATAELLQLDDGLLAAAGFPGVADRAPDSVLFSSGVTTRFAAPRPVPARRASVD